MIVSVLLKYFNLFVFCLFFYDNFGENKSHLILFEIKIVENKSK